jgi:hypothetical protein
VALLGRTDPETADELVVSLSAVKRCWESVYARASLGLPELLPDDSLYLAGGRGMEKRRRLLSYLREHAEELRPVLPPSSRTQARHADRPRDRRQPMVVRS